MKKPLIVALIAVLVVVVSGVCALEFELHRAPRFSVVLRFADPIEVVSPQQNTQKVLYAVVDPQCVYCRQMYVELNAAAAAQGVSVRYLMVGQEDKDSVWLARTILASQDKKQAMNDWFVRDKVAPVNQHELNNPDINHALVTNAWLLFRAVGKKGGTPLLLYADGQGATKAVSGVPPDIEGLVASVGSDQPLLDMRVN